MASSFGRERVFNTFPGGTLRSHVHLFPGMMLVVAAFEFLHVEVGVDLGGGNVGVAEEGLDFAKV